MILNITFPLILKLSLTIVLSGLISLGLYLWFGKVYGDEDFAKKEHRFIRLFERLLTISIFSCVFLFLVSLYLMIWRIDF